MTTTAAPSLSLVSVGHGYRHGLRSVRVLSDVSLEVYPGEVVSVLAPRAQGKTTLLRVAGGMERPASGQVLLGSEDFWSLPDGRRSRLVGAEIGWVDMVPPSLQTPVLTYVAMPLMNSCGRREAYARASATLERVGAGECGAQYWADLADWERVLVAVAQGVAREPKLLLVDDVMATLGLEESEELGRLIGALAQERGFGVLASASDAKATMWSDRVASLAAGELLVASPPKRMGADVIAFPAEGSTVGGKRRDAS